MGVGGGWGVGVSKCENPKLQLNKFHDFESYC